MSAPTLSRMPLLLRRRGLLALGLTIIVAPTLLLVRNLLSDQLAYSRASAAHKAADLRLYLKDGWLHAASARRDLPRLAFAEAKQAGRPEPLQTFIKEFPDSPDKPEAQALLYRCALDLAKRAQNATALRAYLRAYPESPHLAEAQAALHERYASARTAFRKQASRSNPEVTAFVERLIAFLESSGAASVQMRFEAPSNERLKDVDRQLKTRDSNIVPIAEHFGPESTGRMQQTIVSLLGKGFGSVFPADILVLGNRVVPPGVTLPELLIRYEVQPSGTIFKSTTNMFEPSYVGIRIVFRAAFSIPQDARPLDLRFAVEPPNYFTVNYQSSRFGTGGPSANAVYTTMAERAFDNLAERLPAAFFAKDSAAFQAATTFAAQR